MERYQISEAFKRLEKLAELEKRIMGHISDTKGLSSIDESNEIPDSIKESLKIRGSYSVPKPILDDMIDDGMDASVSHMHKHKVMMSPGEALYQAIGKKDEGIYRQAMRFPLRKILSMITNRAAVSATCPNKPMNIEDNDEPKHIKIIIEMRGMNPDTLEKTARDILNTRNALDSFQFIYSNGQKEKFGSKYVKEHKTDIQRLINDGVIIKVIKLLSSGMKDTIYEKNASSEVEDLLYAELLKGVLS